MYEHTCSWWALHHGYLLAHYGPQGLRLGSIQGCSGKKSVHGERLGRLRKIHFRKCAEHPALECVTRQIWVEMKVGKGKGGNTVTTMN